ncbi:MAG: SIS domain-containing protein [Clostridia bacterium]|nr:SIS domain-containing protein [Clostridia bacterium]
MSNMDFVTQLIWRYPVLKSNEKEIRLMCEAVIKSYEAGGKLLVCGNGGSCADAEHIVGELMKGFLKKRPIPADKKAKMLEFVPELSELGIEKLQQGLPAIALNSGAALTTAFANDCDPDLVYAQQVLGLGRRGDVFLGISTSGNAKNVYAAAAVAKSLGITTVALSGKTGGKLKEICDISIVVDEDETYMIQELHLPVYHALCATVEEYFFKE